MKIMDLLGHIRPRAYKSGRYFCGYRRMCGRPGVRNELWIIPTDGDSRAAAKKIASEHHKPYWIDSVRVISVSFDGGPEERSALARSALSGLARSPNAAGVLFVGPEQGEVRMREMIGAIGSEWTRRRVKSVAPGGAEIAHAHTDLDEFAANAPRVREKFMLEELAVGVICAEQDLAGAPQCAEAGRLADAISAQGGVPLVPAYAIDGEGAESRMADRLALSRWKIMHEWSREHICAGQCRGASDASGTMRIAGVLDLGEEARYGGAMAIFARAGVRSGSASAAASCAQLVAATSFDSQSDGPSIIPTIAADGTSEDALEQLIAIASGEKTADEGKDIELRSV